MKQLIIAFASALCLHAAEPADKPATTSPDGRFLVSAPEIGDTKTQRLEIHSAEGKLLYSSPADLKDLSKSKVIQFYPERLKWSDDSKVLAIPAGFPRLFETFLFAWNGSGFDPIPMPPLAAGRDNIGIEPVAWQAGHQLTLKITGPHAGKADHTSYSGSAVVEVDLAKKTARKISEKIVDQHDDDDAE
jgi:hypothetical protein